MLPLFPLGMNRIKFTAFGIVESETSESEMIDDQVQYQTPLSCPNPLKAMKLWQCSSNIQPLSAFL